MRTLTLVAVAAAGIGMGATGASALPFNTAVATAPVAAEVSVDQVRWVCGPYRCFWRPGFHRPYGYGYGYGWRRPYGWRGYGWRRYGWRRRFY